MLGGGLAVLLDRSISSFSRVIEPAADSFEPSADEVMRAQVVIDPYCLTSGGFAGVTSPAALGRMAELIALGEKGDGPLRSLSSQELVSVRHTAEQIAAVTYGNGRILRTTLMVDELEALSSCLAVNEGDCAPGVHIAHLKTNAANADKSWDYLLWKWRAFLIHDIAKNARCPSP